MWEPVGPLPASVYWRRRWVAVATTLGAVVAVSWLVAALLAPASPAVDDLVPLTTQAALATADPTATTVPGDPAVVTAPSDPAVVVVPPAAPPVVVPPEVPPAPSTPTAQKRPVAAPPPADPTTTERLLPDDTPRRTGPVPTPVPVPATGPVACGNAMLAVTAEIDRPTHRVGERPVLRLVVTNSSAQPCVRDLDPARQEIVLWGVDGARLWSSNDCSDAAGVDLRTLVPGQPAVFAVTWAGRTSTPGCTGPRGDVAAGTYNLMTRLDDVISPAVPVTRTP